MSTLLLLERTGKSSNGFNLYSQPIMALVALLYKTTYKYEHQTTIIEEQNFTIFCLMKRANRIELLSQLSKKPLLCMDDKIGPQCLCHVGLDSGNSLFCIEEIPHQ